MGEAVKESELSETHKYGRSVNIVKGVALQPVAIIEPTLLVHNVWP